MYSKKEDSQESNKTLDDGRKPNEPHPDWERNVAYLKTILGLSRIRAKITFKDEEYHWGNPPCERPGPLIMCKDCDLQKTCTYEPIGHSDKVFVQYDGLCKRDGAFETLTHVTFTQYDRVEGKNECSSISFHQYHDKFVKQLERYFSL